SGSGSPAFRDLRLALDLVLEQLERDRLRALQRNGNPRNGPVRGDLAVVRAAPRSRRDPVAVGGIDRWIERRKWVERAVGHHRNALLGDQSTQWYAPRV